jgi:hypothetical protein
MITEKAGDVATAQTVLFISGEKVEPARQAGKLRRTGHKGKQSERGSRASARRTRLRALSGYRRSDAQLRSASVTEVKLPGPLSSTIVRFWLAVKVKLPVS